MALGVAQPVGEIKAGDSAELYASLRIDEQPVSPDQIAQVNFNVGKPDGTQTTDNGIILDDGQGFYRWTDTTEVGLYLVQAQFQLVTGEVRSVMLDFSVVNPFLDIPMEVTVNGNQTFPVTTLNTNGSNLAFGAPGLLLITGITGVVNYTGVTGSTFTGVSGGVGIANDGAVVANYNEPSLTELITQAVWLRIEDTFDTTEGGPWLREQTLRHFDENKIAALIPEVLLDINNQMPPTNFTINDFAQWNVLPGDNPNMPLLVKGTLCATIRHLMRSYVEQPMPQGGQVVWNDRTRYTQAWMAVYQVEYQDYISNVRLWKRTTLNLGQSALSTFSKAGRLFPYGSQRAREAGRGYY